MIGIEIIKRIVIKKIVVKRRSSFVSILVTSLVIAGKSSLQLWVQNSSNLHLIASHVMDNDNPLL